MLNWSEYENEEDRKQRPIILPLIFWLASIACLLGIVAGLSGCAEDRWLTKEEDAQMRSICEPVGGCALIPNPMWEQIKRVLGIVDA